MDDETPKGHSFLKSKTNRVLPDLDNEIERIATSKKRSKDDQLSIHFG